MHKQLFYWNMPLQKVMTFLIPFMGQPENLALTFHCFYALSNRFTFGNRPLEISLFPLFVSFFLGAGPS